MPNSFGQELSYLREQAGYTQYALAQKLNISRTYISLLEKEERKPNKELIKKIQNVINLDPYKFNKLLVLGDCELDVTADFKGLNIIFDLSFDFKQKSLLKKAEYVISHGLTLFDNLIELQALIAQQNFVRDDYENAIAEYNKALNYFNSISEAEKKKLSISHIDIVYCLARIYLYKTSPKRKQLNRIIIDGWEDPDYQRKNENALAKLREEILFDIDNAIKNFELFLERHKECEEYIFIHLAEVYSLKAYYIEEYEESLEKSLYFCDKIITIPSDKIEGLVKIRMLLLLAKVLGRLKKIKEAERIINSILICKTDYLLAYYDKSCIYAINGEDNEYLLNISYEALKKILQSMPYLKEFVRMDLDFKNLRLHKDFKDKFQELIN